jgi:hypothetical protein
VDPVEEAAVDAVGTVIFRDGLILMVNGGKKPSKIGKNYGNIRGIYIYASPPPEPMFEWMRLRQMMHASKQTDQNWLMFPCR